MLLRNYSVVGILVSLICAEAGAVTAIPAQVNGMARDYTGTGVFTEFINAPATDLSIRQFSSAPSGTPRDERAFVEFPVTGLHGTSLTAAEFDFKTIGYTSTTVRVDIYGYAGNGAVSLSDATASGVLLGSYQPTRLGDYAVALNLNALSPLIAANQYVGLRLQGVEANTQIASIGSPFGGTPTLTVTPVPEPASVMLCVPLLACLLKRIRRVR